MLTVRVPEPTVVSPLVIDPVKMVLSRDDVPPCTVPMPEIVDPILNVPPDVGDVMDKTPPPLIVIGGYTFVPVRVSVPAPTVVTTPVIVPVEMSMGGYRVPPTSNVPPEVVDPLDDVPPLNVRPVSDTTRPFMKVFMLAKIGRSIFALIVPICTSDPVETLLAIDDVPVCNVPPLVGTTIFKAPPLVVATAGSVSALLNFVTSE